jgi:hypothetical protein
VTTVDRRTYSCTYSSPETSVAGTTVTTEPLAAIAIRLAGEGLRDSLMSVIS